VKPLGTGTFPEAQRGLPVQAISELLRFNQPAQADSGLEKLLPHKKKSFSVQGRLSEDNLRRLERDLRVSLSSLSNVLWSLEFTNSALEKLKKDSTDQDAFLPAISSCKHALSFLSTVVDRTATSFATSLLMRRDSYIVQMDPLVKEEQVVALRSASFTDPKLFGGVSQNILPDLEKARKESKSQESVDALASLAKKNVSHSTKPSSSSSNQKSFKKKTPSKKSAPANAGQGQVASSQVTSEGGNIKRTFRPSKGKKVSKK